MAFQLTVLYKQPDDTDAFDRYYESTHVPLATKLQGLLGSQGQGSELLPAGAFISMVIPMLVFFTLQRYFVRGLLAGSVKG